MKFFLLYFSGIVALSMGWFSSSGAPAASHSSGSCPQAALVPDTCFADTSICLGDTLFIGGRAIAAVGAYTITSGLPPGCDHALVLNVTERNFYERQLSLTFCQGEHVRVGPYTFRQTGFYEVRLPAQNGCDTLLFMDLTISNISAPDLQSEIDDGSGNGSIDLEMDGDGLSFQWSNGATTEDIDGLEAGEYQVTISNADGCQKYGMVTVEALERFAVPNAFTPNGDKINDHFNLVVNSGTPRIVTFRVYNRWGQLVYDNDNPVKGWDGTFRGEPQDADTYFYHIQVERQAGPAEVLSYQGDVTLLR